LLGERRGFVFARVADVFSSRTRILGWTPLIYRKRYRAGDRGFLFGLFVHSLHTVIVARDGKLSANIEGNEFTAQQFADLLQTVLDPARN
jgi:hypothetical protein